MNWFAEQRHLDGVELEVALPTFVDSARGVRDAATSGVRSAVGAIASGIDQVKDRFDSADDEKVTPVEEA